MGFEPINPLARDSGSQSRRVCQFRHTVERLSGGERRPDRCLDHRRAALLSEAMRTHPRNRLVRSLSVYLIDGLRSRIMLWFRIPKPTSFPDDFVLTQPPQTRADRAFGNLGINLLRSAHDFNAFHSGGRSNAVRHDVDCLTGRSATPWRVGLCHRNLGESTGDRRGLCGRLVGQRSRRHRVVCRVKDGFAAVRPATLIGSLFGFLDNAGNLVARVGHLDTIRKSFKSSS